jgi:hypothetical protein
VSSRTDWPAWRVISHRAPAVLVLLIAVFLVAPSASTASNRTLKTTIARWSHVIAVDAYGIDLSAFRRHPRRMVRRARHFRVDALHARTAIAASRPSTARGLRGKRLALAAFSYYAAVGRQWVLSGQARLQRDTQAAVRHATLARQLSVKGNRTLIAAGRALR